MTIVSKLHILSIATNDIHLTTLWNGEKNKRINRLLTSGCRWTTCKILHLIMLSFTSQLKSEPIHQMQRLYHAEYEGCCVWHLPTICFISLIASTNSRLPSPLNNCVPNSQYIFASFVIAAVSEPGSPKMCMLALSLTIIRTSFSNGESNVSVTRSSWGGSWYPTEILLLATVHPHTLILYIFSSTGWLPPSSSHEIINPIHNSYLSHVLINKQLPSVTRCWSTIGFSFLITTTYQVLYRSSWATLQNKPTISTAQQSLFVTQAWAMAACTIQKTTSLIIKQSWDLEPV